MYVSSENFDKSFIRIEHIFSKVGLYLEKDKQNFQSETYKCVCFLWCQQKIFTCLFRYDIHKY